MKKIYFSAVVALALIMCGCNGNKTEGQASGLSDSTLIDAPLAEQEVQDMVNVISEVVGCLDSIQIQEQMLFKTDEMASKGEVLGRLRAFKDLLARKQSEIDQLTANSSSNKAAIANLKKMVDYLKGQLEEKTKRIAELEEAVETKDVKISELMYSRYRTEQGVVPCGQQEGTERPRPAQGRFPLQEACRLCQHRQEQVYRERQAHGQEDHHQQ